MIDNWPTAKCIIFPWIHKTCDWLSEESIKMSVKYWDFLQKVTDFLDYWILFTLFFTFLVPFGQMSFWGATVITNLLSPFPSLIEWVCGGHYVYNPSLKRFFLFHFQFSFLLCGLGILHLFYLHFHSSNNPLRLNTNNKNGKLTK